MGMCGWLSVGGGGGGLIGSVHMCLCNCVCPAPYLLLFGRHV